MSKKRKGTSSSRTRANNKRELPQVEESAPMVDLEAEMQFQAATQAVADRYEEQIRKLREHHQKEMQSLLMGIDADLISKPSLWARLTGRYKDIYVIFNHNLPVWCPKKACPTRREGINWGIEAVTTELNIAFDHISDYFNRNKDNDYAHAKLLHLQVDRKRGQGAVVDELSWTWALWRNSDHYHDKRKVSAKTVDKLVKSVR
tara:strand:- start:500 stop:1108 length:609 start_codon:yes stop_codon:yes gene_type:complete